MQIRIKSILKAFSMVGALIALLPASGYAQSGNDGAIEEVVVTGIRGALQDAASVKQSASGIVDAISAEELGKFPDTNIAESLQRIPGVAIARTRGGGGRFVTIRGLGEEFNAVTYNGRLLATENAGREFSFDNVASELVRRAEVFKTAQTSHGDGSIGGRVNLVTARPFDEMGMRSAFSAAGIYDDLADDNGIQASGIISNTFANDTFGVLASVNYIERDFRVDTAQSIDTFQLDVDDAGNGYAVGSAPAGTNIIANSARYTSVAVGTTTEQRERIGGTLVLQWRPSDTAEYTFDALFTSFESPGLGAWQTNYPCPACGTTSNITVADNNIITAFDSAISSEYLATQQVSDTDTVQYGLNGNWQISDVLTLEADISYSKADGIRDNFGSGSGSGSFYVIGVPGGRFEYRYNGGKVPSINSFAPAFDPVTGTASGPPVDDTNNVDPRVFGAHFTRDTSNFVSDEVTTFKLDGEWEFNESATLQFGADYYDRNKVNNLFNNRNTWCNYWCGFEYSLRGLNPDVFDASFIQPFPVSDFLQDAGASIPNNFITFSPQALRDLYASVSQGGPIFDSNGNPTTANNDNGFLADGVTPCTGSSTTHDFTCFDEAATGGDILQPRLRRDSSTDLTETVFGVYGQLNVEGQLGDIPWTANIGVRIAHTRLDSKGFSNEIIDIQPAAGADQIFTFSNDTPRNLDNDYTDVLPAFNIAFDLRDDLILRAAFAQTITRPTLTDLSTARTVTGTNVDVEAITSGNPELGPTRSDNLDFSLEWYGENITAAVAIFKKDITDFIADAVTEEFVFDRNFQITKPTNGDTAEVTGLELAWVQYFDSGFGYQANYTFADSTATAADGSVTSLENVSENSLNLSAFFENDRFGTRLSYNLRDDYVRAAEGLQGFPEIVDSYGQLDFTASYHVNDFFTVFFEAANITDEDEFVFSDQRNLLRYYEERSARYNFGLRGAF